VKKGAELQWKQDEEEKKKQQQEQERIKQENDRLQRELADKKKSEDEQRKNELADQKRLSKAPDSSILIEISDRIKIFPLSFPEVKSPEAKEILEEAIAIIKKVGADLATQAKSLNS
jgi:cell division septum initiation protein DivIVA